MKLARGCCWGILTEFFRPPSFFLLPLDSTFVSFALSIPAKLPLSKWKFPLETLRWPTLRTPLHSLALPPPVEPPRSRKRADLLRARIRFASLPTMTASSSPSRIARLPSSSPSVSSNPSLVSSSGASRVLRTRFFDV